MTRNKMDAILSKCSVEIEEDCDGLDTEFDDSDDQIPDSDGDGLNDRDESFWCTEFWCTDPFAYRQR